MQYLVFRHTLGRHIYISSSPQPYIISYQAASSTLHPFSKKEASRCQNVYKMRYLVSPSEERALMLTVLSLLQPMPSS